MPKKRLTPDVAREIANTLEDGLIERLSIRPRVSGKNKGKLFAEWRETPAKDGDTVKDDNPEYLTLKLVETLEDVATRLEEGHKIELHVSKNTETQYVSYVRGDK